MYDYKNPPPLVIIGLELRLRTPDGLQQEIGMWGTHLELPAFMAANYQPSFNGTIHTSNGDVNFGNNERLYVPLGGSLMQTKRTH